MEIVRGQRELSQVVLALRGPHRLPRLLYRGQQERNQHADDRDDNQQLDERERSTGP